jgi:hypothetical protein
VRGRLVAWDGGHMPTLTKAARLARRAALTQAYTDSQVAVLLTGLLSDRTDLLLALVQRAEAMAPPSAALVALLTTLSADPGVGQYSRAVLAEWAKRDGNSG